MRTHPPLHWLAFASLCALAVGCSSAPHEHTSLLSPSRMTEVRPRRIVLEIVQSEHASTHAPADAVYEGAAAQLAERGYTLIEGGSSSETDDWDRKSLSGESQGCPCSIARENFFVHQQARETAAMLRSLGADALLRLTLTEAERGETPDRVYVSARAELLAAADPAGPPIWSAYLTRGVSGPDARELSHEAATAFGRAVAAALPASAR